MLAPVPSVYQSTSDSIAVGNTLVPSIPIESDAWRLQSPPSPAESTTATTFHRTRSIPKARPSTISRPSSYHHHLHRRSSHHHNRPSKQFVATTSSSIFGDWDIELKIDHRTLAKSNNAPSAVGRVAPAAAGRVGGGVGGSGSIVTIGTGPGVHTGSSGTQPLSTFPTSSSTTAPAVGGELSPALKMLKGELPQTPNSTTKTLKNNTTTTTPTKATITTPTSTKATIPKNNNTQPPWKTGQPKKNTNIDAMAAPTATVSAAAAAAAKKSWSKPDADETVNNEAASGLNALPAPTARSSFLKALGKFKTKHLQQKR
ncbi:hypothetical protein EDD21DRAFT_422091 [Dissophora ornata]|nr:hypothetical protein EDD21DRAFT_422091 [Dissophora ornata]